LKPILLFAYEGPEVTGDFSNFNAPGILFTASVDEELLSAIRKAAASQNYEVTRLREHDLDHGTAVPLYFLQRNGFHGKVVTLGYSFMSNDDHLRFGSCIRKAVEEVGRRVAFIASGDLSHRLKPQRAAATIRRRTFRRSGCRALRSNVPQRIVEIDHSLREACG
jgi:AmmeMemoRadiSam system protein B